MPNENQDQKEHDELIRVKLPWGAVYMRESALRDLRRSDPEFFKGEIHGSPNDNNPGLQAVESILSSREQNAANEESQG